MKNIIVLGSGMVGSAMAIDMANKHKVTVSDINDKALQNIKEKCNDLSTLQLDVTDKAKLKETLKPFDLVICAVPGFLGFETLKAIFEAQKNVIDISFFPENSLELDDLARKNGITAIVDIGVAPGMDNIILGYYNQKFKIDFFECLVGGLPKVKKWPFNYKAPFSPIDVIEEYTRPARYVENGKVVTKDPLSDIELIEFENVGTLESFNSDGLRTIIDTMSHIPNMKEKTLRYPGHAEYVSVLKASGFFEKEKVNVNGVEVSPLDFTCKILFNEWKLGEFEEEITVMRVTLKGEDKQGKRIEVVYNLHDTYSDKTKTSSMARTTGYTATAAANLFLDGLFDQKGVFPPELIAKENGVFDYFIKYLAERGVVYRND
ncbi:MAG: saccharopine dehydrogenase [Bacteroidetes bacterium]|nr:MAG: saccharopine dehydrogenase [Bacteroidota bacterium]